MEQREKLLGEEKISKLLLKFSIPAIVGMVIQSLYNVVDRMFIGQVVGPEAIAGLTITFPIMMVTMAFGMLIGVGSGALTSLKLGQGKGKEANTILGNAILLSILSYIVLFIVGHTFKEQILYAFGATETTVSYALSYISIILTGLIFQFGGFAMNNFIRAEGNAKIAMGTMVIGAITNIILDYLFVVQFGWAIQGAACATVIAQMVSTVWIFRYFMSDGSMYKLGVKYLKPNIKIIKSIFAIGMAPFAMQLAGAGVSLIYNTTLVAYGGDNAIAAYGIINSVFMMLLMPILGINQGAQPIIGFNYGAEKYDRVKQTLKLAAIAATVLTTIGFIFIQSVPDLVVSAFNNGDQELQAIGVDAARKVSLALPIIGAQIIGANYFQAVGKAKIAMVLSLSRQVLILAPMLIILSRIWGLDGIWFATPISDIGAAIVTAVFIVRELRWMSRKIAEQNGDVMQGESMQGESMQGKMENV